MTDTAPAPTSLVAIAAVAANGVIGADGNIPWRISEDWARFKRLTSGHALIMGRKTYVSIGRPLPGRHTVVLTRDPDWRPDGDPAGVEVVTDFERAVERAHRCGLDGPVYVAGGEEIYRLAWPRLDALEITEVDQRPDGSTRFPSVSTEDWRLVERDDRDGYAFCRYVRRAPGEPADR